MTDETQEHIVSGIGKIGIEGAGQTIYFELIGSDKSRIRHKVPFEMAGKVIFALQGVFQSAVAENAKRPGFDPTQHSIPFRADKFRTAIAAAPDRTTAVFLQMTSDKGLALTLSFSTEQARQLGRALTETANSNPPLPRKPS